MEAKELMIGDWVNWHTYTNRPNYCKIKQASFDTHIEGSDDFNCEPIPLTEDILVANGFVYDEILHKTHNDKEYYSHEYVELKDCLDDHFYPIPNTYRINVLGREIRLFYVHQLQHALRLCGLGNLADSFKLE